MAAMGYEGVWGKLIHQKKLRRKSSDFNYPTEGNQDTAYITTTHDNKV